jgi:hypothetical protein
MKKDKRAELAEEFGISVKFLDWAMQHPEEAKKVLEKNNVGNSKPPFPSRPVKNPTHREEKVIEQYGNAPKRKYEQREKSDRIRRGKIDPSTWLINQYTNDDRQMICQICEEEMPFRKRNGDYYFEAVELLSKDYLSKEYEAQFLALCPLCSAMYKEFIKPVKEEMENLKQEILGTNKPIIPIKFGELTGTLRFVETHFNDLKVILRKSQRAKEIQNVTRSNTLIRSKEIPFSL